MQLREYHLYSYTTECKLIARLLTECRRQQKLDKGYQQHKALSHADNNVL